MNTLQNKSSGVTGSRRSSLKRTLLVRFKLVLCIVLLILAIGNQKIFGQGVGISEVSIVPDGTSILELRSTLRGFLAPRMTTAARLAIASPAQGLLVYDTSAKSFWYYDSGWKSIAAEALGASNQLLGMNAAGTANEYKTLYGTANQIYVTNGIGSITLSTPQNIHNGASPTFFGLTLTGLTPNSGVYTNNTNGLTSTPPSIGIIGYWNRTGTVLSPSNAGDAVTTSGNIYTTGGGAITSSGLLTGSAGATISGGIINLNNSSNFATNINTGTSTSNVTIGNSANSLYLPKFTIPGVLHNDATGLVSSSLIVNSDITNNSINLTQKVTGVLPVLHGGTGLATFGGTNTVLYTSAPDVLTSVAASTAAGQFLQTSTTGGAPAWKTILDVGNGGTGLANITTNYLIYGNGTAPINLLAPGSTTGALLTTTATGAPGWLTLNTLPATSGILQVRNGGTGYDNTYSNGQLLIGNSTGTLTRNALTGTVNQVYVTNGDGTITLALPQDIHTGAEPIFQGLTLNGLTASAGVYTDASKKLTSSPPASGSIGYWNRTGTVLSPSNAGDAITTSGNISTTGTGTITSAGLLTGSAGATISGGAVNINNNSNFATNINTGTSAGAVRIGGSSNTITLPAFTAAGIVHNDNAGLLSTSLIVNNDIAIGTIDLTSRVTNVLPIVNGGTNSSTVLTDNKIMVSSSGKIVEGPAGTTTTVLHGNASGAPSYSQVVNADIASNAVTTDKILDGEVKTADIADANVTAIKLTAGAGTAGRVGVSDALGAITYGNIPAGSITGNNLTSTDLTVLGGTGATLTAVTLNIANDAVTNAKMADNAIGTLELQDNAVTTSKISDANVTLVKLGTSGVADASKIYSTDGAGVPILIPISTFATNNLLDGHIFIGDAANVAVGRLMSGDATISNTGVLTISDNAITTNKIANLNVTNAKLSSDAVTTDKILDGEVKTADIADANVTATKLTAGAGTAGRVGVADALGAITYGNLPAGSITGNNLTSTDLTVTGGTGATLTAVTLALADNSVTYAKMQTVSTTSKLLGSSSTTIPVQEITIGSGLTLTGTTLNAAGLGGTVTSVGLSLPSFITVTNSPVTGSGVLTGTLASQSANTVFAAPNGSAGSPTFRSLLAADIPVLDWSKITTGKPTTLAGYGITDAALSTHNHTIDGLSNVTITGKANNDILQWNGSAWVNKTLSGAGIITSETDPIVKAINGIVKSNGTTISAAVAGTDYIAPNAAITAGTNTKITYDTKGLVTAGASAVLASADYAGQGTATAVLHGGGAGNPSWSQIVNADVDPAAGIVDSKLATISTAGKVSNSATTATSANTANTIVLRDASGNFSAGTITATLSGNATSATSATSATTAGIATNLSGGAGGSIPYQSGASTTAMLSNGTAGQVLTSNGTTLAPSWTNPTNGTVTSVGLSLPAFITVTNSPVTGSGTLTGTLASQTANTFFAAPNGSAGTPTFRSIVAADIPNIAESQVTNLVTDLSNRALTSTTINGHALSSNVVISASDITTGTLPHAQLPALVSGDIPNNGANTTGNAATATTATTATNAINTAITNDVATATSVYPTWVTANTGNLPQTVSSTKLSFVPSTGILTATGFAGPLTGNATTATTATNIAGGSLGTILYQSGAGTTSMSGVGTSGQVLTSGGAGAPTWTNPTNGTVTSVGLSLPAFITVSNSPVTGSGTLTGTLASQSANTVFAAPNGSAGAPTFRSLVAADIPNIAESQVTNLSTDLSNRALTSTTVNGHALSANVVVSASDITTGTLPHAQLPALVSGDIPNNAANTSGNAATATTATSATTASNLSGGSIGTIPYQSGIGTTSMLAVGSTGQILRSAGAGAPTWSTATYPGTTTINRLLYSSAANTVSELATANNGILVTSAAGVPSIANSVGAALTMPSINLSAASNQLVLQSAGVSGTLSWTPTSSNKTITFPDASGTVALVNAGANWVVSGNAGTNPVNDFIGTTDPNDLVFRVNNIERARFVSATGDIKIGDATSGTVRSALEMVMREDGDQYGASILRLRNRGGENGAIFETVPNALNAYLVDFIFKTSDGGSGTIQRNIRYEARSAFARTGYPSFEIGGLNPDNATLSLGDNYAAFARPLYVGSLTLLNFPVGTAYPTPTALLQLASGTATANTAPLKFTAGTNLTTPEDGAVEYDGTNYSVTNNTAKRYTLAKTLTNTATLDFTSTGAQSNSDINITVTGAALNDAVVLGIPNASITANSTFTAWVSSANTVTVRFNNYSSSAKDPASGSFRVSVLQY
jgi:hypothetical protein